MMSLKKQKSKLEKAALQLDFAVQFLLELKYDV